MQFPHKNRNTMCTSKAPISENGVSLIRKRVPQKETSMGKCGGGVGGPRCTRSPRGSAGASLRSAPINYSYRILCETKDSVFQLSFTRLQNFPLSLGRRGWVSCVLYVERVGSGSRVPRGSRLPTLLANLCPVPLRLLRELVWVAVLIFSFNEAPAKESLSGDAFFHGDLQIC